MRAVSAVGSKLTVLLLLWVQTAVSFAGIWQETAEKALEYNAGTVYYRALKADHAALRQALAAAPLEYTSSQGAEIILPMPDGSMQRFEVENSPIMAPELAARYPEIETYRVRGVDDPTATGRLDMTPKGFHGMLSSSVGTAYIDPERNGVYLSYYGQDYVTASKGLTDGENRPVCLVESEVDSTAAFRPAVEVAQRISDARRIYRLALAATGEYTQFHGGTVAEALAAMVTAINRVNQIYGRDVAIQFVLVSNTDSVIYTDPDTDPYTNNNGSEMLDENQATLDRVIGSANYDIGHVFSTGGGGIAVVGGACRTDYKAKGVTGRPDPEGDLFYIDLVAHEMGHQMNAAHSFNGTTNACVVPNRVPDSAVEPGSGSTIMSYAGICGVENLQAVTDATFHAMSIQQIMGFSTSGAGASCGVLDSTGNTAPSVDAGVDRTIPLCTPFILNGSASDVDGDILAYQWDEMDIGTETDEETFGTDLGDNPLFRSYTTKDTGERVFPRISALVRGTTYKGEVLPAAARTMNFRLTVRDGNSGVNEDDMRVAVDSSMGPFLVSGGVLNSGGFFLQGSKQGIEWSVGDTAITCPKVVISLLAFNANGTAYCDESGNPDLDLGEYPNIGSATLTLPNLSIMKGRVKIACANNIYFSISDADFQINGTNAVSTSCKNIDILSSDGSGDLVEVCRAQGDLPLSTVSDDDGGGGAIFLLLPLLGFRVAGRAMKRSRRRSA